MRTGFSWNNQKGYSLVEVMMVVSIMSFVGLGVATMMKNMMSVQRRQELRPTLRQIKDEIEQAFLNDHAWESTIINPSNNASLGCLRDGNTCADGTAVNDIRLRNAQDPQTAATSGNSNFDAFEGPNNGAGWTFSGARCTTWNAAGNDACPIRYNLTLTMSCSNGLDPCARPLVTLTGALNYAPNDRSSINNRINADDYQIEIRRGERVRFEPFQILMEQAGAGVGGGACTNLGWDKRPLSRLAGNRTGNENVLFNDANDQFTLVAGRYSCEIIAEGFDAVDGFRVELRTVPDVVAARVPSGHAISLANSSVYSKSTIYLDLVNDTTFELYHYCHDDGVSGGSGHVNGMGNPVAFDPAFPKVYTSIKCTRSS